MTAPAVRPRRSGPLRRAARAVGRLFAGGPRRPDAVPALAPASAPPDEAEVRASLAPALGRLAGGDLLIGLDVDGTLVHHDGSMSQRVHDALQAAASRQRVVIATGRSVGATLPIVRAAGITRGFAVCSNGAVTLELDPEAEGGYRVVDVQTFDPGHALRALREAAPGARSAVETADGAFYATDGFQDASFGVEARDVPFEELTGLEAVRVVVHDPDLGPEEFSRIVAASGVHGVEYAIGWTAWLDMAAPGVSKATALERVRETLGVEPERTVTVGDGFNDVEMLRWAGVGVAMGQAPQGVADAADVRTATVWDDGAAVVLELATG